MGSLFNRVPLVAILGFAIGRLACADTIDVPQPGGSAGPEVNAAFSQVSRLPPHEPPLRLALTLSEERRPAAPRLRERAQEPAAVQLTPQIRPLRPAALARLQEPDVKRAEQAGNEDALQQKKTEVKTEARAEARAEAATADPARTWEIATDDRTLNANLARWSASAGWQLIWELEVDYPIETRAVVQGTFEEAVAAVAESLAGASVPIQATFYAGNKVLRIVAKGSK
jgi:hypothetical protein